MRLIDPPTTPRIPEPRRTVYRWFFYAAAFYNTVWGIVVILAPGWTLELATIETSAITNLFWQCIGMFVMVFALGYWAAARDPERYAPFILIATLGKVFGPIGFVYGAFYLEALPKWLGVTILTNDLVWWPAFFAFCYETMLKRRGPLVT
ncbi:MAG: alkyl hydroperoxide reductase [Planctomycetota bacterium]